MGKAMWINWKSGLAAVTAVGGLAFTTVLALDHRAAAKGGKTDTVTIEITHVRWIALPSVVYPAGGYVGGMAPPGPDVDASAADPAAGTPPDYVGPFYVAKGDVVRVDGIPAHGQYVARGVLFTTKDRPQPHGVAQESLSVDVDSQGILFGQELAGSASSPAGVILGGTGAYVGAAGTYAETGGLPKFSHGGAVSGDTLTLTFQRSRRG